VVTNGADWARTIIQPLLVVGDAVAAIDFYTRVFNATEQWRLMHYHRIGHAVLRVGVSSARPTTGPLRPVVAWRHPQWPVPNYRGNNGGFLDDKYTQLVQAAASEPDAGKRKLLYSQLNDFLLDAAFVFPLASRQTRSLARTNVHDVGHRRNEMYTFHRAWLT
jgi:ABC-type transport system substrate-binding protein